MATIKLIPSTYYLSSSYLSVSDASNMYADTSSTNYATVTNSRTSTSSYYIYVRGFNFDDVPSNAIVNSFTIKIKCNYSGGYSQAMYLYDGTSTSYGSSDSISSTVTTHTFTCNYSWEDVVAADSDFGIRINCRRNSRNTTSYIYIYGAEILVDYTIPVYHSITVTGDSTKVSPTGTESVLEGTSFSVSANYNSRPTVTDNSVDVSSQLVESTGGTSTLIPYDYTNNGFTVSNIGNAYHDASNTTYATFDAAGGGTARNVYLDIGGVTIPSTATIISVSCSATIQFSRNGSSSGVTASCQMYSGSTAKGSSTSITTSATDVAKTTFNLNIGSWTATELSNARFYMAMTNNASSTHRYLYLYGVSLVVTYSVDGKIYTYTLSNIAGNHTIVITAPQSNTLYLKVNNSWVEVSEVYVKTNGTWVKQNDISNIFNTSTNYVQR